MEVASCPLPGDGYSKGKELTGAEEGEDVWKVKVGEWKELMSEVANDDTSPEPLVDALLNSGMIGICMGSGKR